MMKEKDLPSPYREMISPESRNKKLPSRSVIQQVKRELRNRKQKNEKAISDSMDARRALMIPEPRLLYCLPDGWEAVNLERPELFYKVVAVDNKRMLSVFDGMTEYRLGIRLESRRGVGSPLGWPPLDCCFYAQPTPEQAVNTEFPRNSALAGAPKLLVQVRSEGRAYKNTGTGQWAFSNLTPTILLSDVTEGSSFVISTRYISPPRRQGVLDTSQSFQD